VPAKKDSTQHTHTHKIFGLYSSSRIPFTFLQHRGPAAAALVSTMGEKKVHIEETHFVQTPFILSNFPRFNLK
jgi:hypothetical protein